MGGAVNKEKFVNKDGSPARFFRLSDNRLSWICGGCFPAFSSFLDYLSEQNVGLIVTLVIEPIKSGRNINHIPSDHDQTEWVDGDDNLEEKLEKLHIPIADTGFPTLENANLLVEKVQKYNQENPDKSVYFYCWAGRVSLAISYILMKMYKMNWTEATEMVKKHVE